jgi:hypothetical protein
LVLCADSFQICAILQNLRSPLQNLQNLEKPAAKFAILDRKILGTLLIINQYDVILKNRTIDDKI